MAVCPIDYEMLPYIEIVLSAQVERIKNAAKGLIPGIERKTILDGLVSLPPLAEQQRIVERINEIMPLIDRLEKLERERCCRFPLLAGSAELDSPAGRRGQTRPAGSERRTCGHSARSDP